ncbi:DUF2802 domain-containing protein [Legionella fairfieldensis]|uniref:DUF2802 domain-containing protein n=1 Tax=Legionella fairfieldensis TaxID=45064 RepID=UPI003BF8820C
MVGLSAGLLSSAIILKMVFYYRKTFSMLTRQVNGLKTELEQQQINHRLLINADLSFARQIKEITNQLVSMDNQLQALENKRDNDGSYQHAFRILEMGGDKEEIINSCHLSSAEAELLMNLNAYRAVIKTHSKMASD